MEVHFSPELETKVNRVAAENCTNADEYVQQLVEHFVDHDAWFRQRSGRVWISSTAANFLNHEEVGESVERMFHS